MKTKKTTAEKSDVRRKGPKRKEKKSIREIPSKKHPSYPQRVLRVHIDPRYQRIYTYIVPPPFPLPLPATGTRHTTRNYPTPHSEQEQDAKSKEKGNYSREKKIAYI
jgi:hypothetical protein